MLLAARRSYRSILALDGMQEIATTEASVSRTYMPLFFGMPNTAASQNSIFSLKGLFCCVVPREFLVDMSHEMLHRLYLVRVTFDELSLR